VWQKPNRASHVKQPQEYAPAKLLRRTRINRQAPCLISCWKAAGLRAQGNSEGATAVVAPVALDNLDHIADVAVDSD